jgi:hypothetical protein
LDQIAAAIVTSEGKSASHALFKSSPFENLVPYVFFTVGLFSPDPDLALDRMNTKGIGRKRR